MSMTRKEYRELLERSAGDGTFPSINMHDKVCHYRMVGEDGTIHKCAIGVAIPDEVYEPLDERTGVRELVWGKYRPYLPDDLEPSQLFRIQEAHDDVAVQGWDADEFVRRIRELSFFRDTLSPGEVPTP